MIAPEENIAEARLIYGQTMEEILAKEPEHGIFKVLGALEVLVGSKIYQKLPTSLGERMIFAFIWMARETQNGGFHQFFINSAGDYWKDILAGLSAIQDQNASARFQHILSIFPGAQPSLDRSERIDQLNALEEENEDLVSDHFNQLNQEYFSNPFPNWQSVFDYVKTHPDEFDLHNA